MAFANSTSQSLYSKGALHVFSVAAVLLLTIAPLWYVYAASPLERTISLVFPNTPTMVDVARCESGLRHYLPDGSVLRGGLGGKMIGLFQLHETYHRAPARSMGLDIDTLAGNLLYTRNLYRSEGLTPWRSSAHCWDNEARDTEQTPVTLKTTLRYGARGGEVGSVQQALSSAGYLVAGTYEEKHFDIKTLAALMRFQCDSGIACLGDGVAGMGTTNLPTRAALLEYL